MRFMFVAVMGLGMDGVYVYASSCTTLPVLITIQIRKTGGDVQHGDHYYVCLSHVDVRWVGLGREGTRCWMG